MKRLHVSISVDDLAASVSFYSTLFDAKPAVLELDYAKWVLDDPSVNFTIEARGDSAGLDHLGLQVDTVEEVDEIADRLSAANVPMRARRRVSCCYARSDKAWSKDPQKVRWEIFRTAERIPTYSEGGCECD